MVAERKEDRRVQRTKQLLRDALMDLIIATGEDSAKTYDTITIQDIADKANVARTTFYLHYKDKDELLFEGMREIYDGLFASAQDNPGNLLDWEELMGDASDFLHVAKHADFYRVMLSEKGSASFLMRLQQYLGAMIYQHILQCRVDELNLTPRISLEMLSYAMAGSLIGAIKWWLDNDMKIPAQDIALQLEQYAVFGLPWSIGAPDADKPV